jgi:putative tryptophan/tyrosine transport system substrate-binding protein
MSAIGSTAGFPLFSISRRLLAATVCLTAGLGCRASERRATADSAAATTTSTANASTAGVPVIAVVRAADWIGSEWSEDAIRVGLQEEGMNEGRDYTFKFLSAQGDLATLPALMDAALDAKAKVIVTLQDPTLKVAVQRVKDTPIVFHVLSDPFAAGAGKSDSSHLANVTGVYSPGFGDPEQEKRIALIKRVVPGAKRVGVLFSPDEPYAVAMKDKMISTGRRLGIEVIGVPVPTVNDGAPAAATAVSRKVDAIEIFGNTAHAAFPSIIKAANDANVPVFSPSPFEMLKGARAAIYPDFAEGGVVAGHMIGRIMKGESAGRIPFHRIETTKEQINAPRADASDGAAPRPSLAMAGANANRG